MIEASNPPASEKIALSIRWNEASKKNPLRTKIQVLAGKVGEL
jgi:hypothetical protein